jgi:hypothetical protein
MQDFTQGIRIGSQLWHIQTNISSSKSVSTVYLWTLNTVSYISIHITEHTTKRTYHIQSSIKLLNDTNGMNEYAHVAKFARYRLVSIFKAKDFFGPWLQFKQSDGHFWNGGKRRQNVRINPCRPYALNSNMVMILVMVAKIKSNVIDNYLLHEHHGAHSFFKTLGASTLFPTVQHFRHGGIIQIVRQYHDAKCYVVELAVLKMRCSTVEFVS